jgi:hypothetical protein
LHRRKETNDTVKEQILITKIKIEAAGSAEAAATTATAAEEGRL